MANALVPELAVRDLSRSLRFYVETIRFTVAYSRPEDGFAYLRLGSAELMLDEIGRGRTFGAVTADTPLGRGLNLQIRVATIGPILAALGTVDIAPAVGPEDRRYRVAEIESGNRQFVVSDPDGYLLRFYEDVGTRPIATGEPARRAPR